MSHPVPPQPSRVDTARSDAASTPPVVRPLPEFLPHVPPPGPHSPIERESERLRGLWATPGNALGRGLEKTLGFMPSRETHALDLLRRPEVVYADLARVEGIGAGVDDPAVIEQIEVQAKYAGYLDRQRDEIARQRRNEETTIPERFDFAGVRGLSAEVHAKLVTVQPRTIGQAMRISGVTPAAISLLLVHLKRGGRRVA